MSMSEGKPRSVVRNIVIAVVLIAIIAAGAYWYTTSKPRATITPTVTEKPTTKPLETTTVMATPTPTVEAPTTLVVDKVEEPSSLDPAFCYEFSGWEIVQNVYQTLVTYDRADPNKFVGLIAESWTVSEDGKVYTFKLKKNVVFSDGTPLTADAVEYSLKRVIVMNQAPSWIISQSLTADSIKVIDDYTVQLTLEKPNPAFLATLASATASIVNPKVVEAHGGVKPDTVNPWMDENVAGSGPFTLKEWVKGDHLTLIRNENYWGDKPALKEVVIYYKSDVLTRILDLKKGTAHIAVVDPVHLDDIKDEPGIVIRDLGPTFHIDFLFFNTQKPPFDNKLVRQAAAHAINYDAIKQILRGKGERYVGPIPKGMFGYDDSVQPYTYDVELAKSLLSKAGHPDGKGLGTLKFLYYSRDEAVDLMAQQIQSDLAKIGMKIELQSLSLSTYMNNLFLDPKDPNYPHMGWTEWYPDYASPDDYAKPFLTWPPGWNPAAYQDKEVANMIFEAASELDKDKAKQLWSEVIHRVYEDTPYAWLMQYTGYYVYRDNVHGLYYHPIHIGYSGFDYSTIYLTPSS